MENTEVSLSTSILAAVKRFLRSKGCQVNEAPDPYDPTVEATFSNEETNVLAGYVSTFFDPSFNVVSAANSLAYPSLLPENFLDAVGVFDSKVEEGAESEEGKQESVDKPAAVSETKEPVKEAVEEPVKEVMAEDKPVENLESNPVESGGEPATDPVKSEEPATQPEDDKVVEPAKPASRKKKA